MFVDSTRPTTGAAEPSCASLALGMLVILLTALSARSAVGQTIVPTGPARWLVEFRAGGVDLVPLRRALQRRHVDEAHSLIADYERQVEVDREAFRARVLAGGGRVLRHGWLVNASHVEADAALAAQLANDPAVARIDRDLLVAGHDGKPLDHFNHGAEFGFAIGSDGSSAAGAIIAIMDSGIDSDMNGLGRPHRAFFAGGDPANTTPGGIGGSRIVLNQAFGALPADDVHGHGTSAAAVTAGANWGTPNATDGHARGALIASYGIGDQIGPTGGIFAFYSTIVTAWQQMLADKASFNIVAANNSFGGEQDPLHATQQALDAAAWAGDILITVSAGNSGNAAQTGGQSAVNGLAVAAVAEDSHERFPFSSRGPVVGDLLRTYPDLSAIAWARVPIQDCETVDGLFGLTSSAAPRVAGAAMVVRAANPTMFADEVKAVLLASTLDLMEANPSADRNALGVGLLRQDTALRTAANAASHTRDTIQQIGQPRNHAFQTIPGLRYGVAVTWMRDRTIDTNWSDLDVRVLDGVTLQPIATAASPRNLYEHSTFTGPPSGSVIIEVTANVLGTTAQEFAVAVARLIDKPRRGSFRVAGPGCNGPLANSDATCVSINPSATAAAMAQPIDDVPYSGRYGHAIEITAPASGMTLTGFDLFTRSLGTAELATAVFLDTGNGQPQPTPIRTGTLTTRDAEQWYRTLISPPLALSPNQRVYLGVENWSKSTIRLDPTLAPQTARLFFRERCVGSAWIGWFFEHIGLRVICSDQQTAAIPRHETIGSIRITESADVRCEYLPPNAPITLAIGFSQTTWAGIPLPLDLSLFGGSGCFLRTALPLAVATSSDANGIANVSLRFGNGTGLLGRHVFTQFLVVDPLRPRAVTLSNSGENIIGTR